MNLSIGKSVMWNRMDMRKENRMRTKGIGAGLLLATTFVFMPPVWAQAKDPDKLAAVDRYLRAVPMSKMMEDMYAEMAKQLPPEKRQEFITGMRKAINIPRVEEIARDAMIKTFSAEELNALADFYSSKYGASAMAKFGTYMGEAMPRIMKEVMASVETVKRQHDEKGN